LQTKPSRALLFPLHPPHPAPHKCASDAEFLLRSYALWSPCLEPEDEHSPVAQLATLRGPFAFVLYDRTCRRILVRAGVVDVLR
jgi:hypothetical protein